MAQLNWKPSYDGSALRWRPSYLPEELPEAPSGTVTIGAITPTSSGASVAITYDGDDATGFEYRIDGGSAVSGGSASPIVVSGLSASTEYDLEIRPTNDGGEGAWSAVATFETRMANPGDRAVMVRKISIVDPEEPVETFEFDEGSVDDPIQLEPGGTFDLSQYISGGATPYKPLTIKTGELPAGVTLDPETWVLSASAEATPVLSDDVTFEALDAEEEDEEPGGGDPGGEDPDPDPEPPEPGDLPTFGITSAVGGSDLPFAFGHVFAKGDVPSGHYVDSDLTDWQCSPTTYWPDGSLRHAIIAGRANCTASVLKSITLGTSDTDRSGAPLTESDLASALAGMGTTNVVAGAETITLADLVGTGAKHRTVCAGPVMSNWLYRKQLTGSDHVVVWFDVRLFKGGAVEVFPYVANGFMYVSGPTNDERTWTVNVDGVQVYSGTLDIKHHQRPVLLSGAAHSYWAGADPEIVPAHDTAYLDSTLMVPHYEGTPTGDALDGLTQSASPLGLADMPSLMGAGGAHPSIGLLPQWDALYCMTGDARAYRSVIVNGCATGAFGVHYYDENTNDPPIPGSFPNASMDNGSPAFPTPTGGDPAQYTPTHCPAFGYLAWVLTGRWYFLEALQFQVFRNYIELQPAYRVDGLIDSVRGTTTRGAAWQLRTLAQALVSTPAGDMKDSLASMWAVNMAYYASRYGPGGEDENELGIVRSYEMGSGGYNGADTWRWASGFMQNYLVSAVGYGWDLEPTGDAEVRADHETFRDFLYQFPTGLAGDDWCYQRASAYQIPAVKSKVSGYPWATWAEAWAKDIDYYSLSATCSPGQALKEGNDANDVTISSSYALTSGYWAWYLSGMAFAVSHGADGAASGYSKVQASPSWSQRSHQNTADYGVWAIYPRSA